MRKIYVFVLLTLLSCSTKDKKNEHFYYDPPIGNGDFLENESTERNNSVPPVSLRIVTTNLWNGGMIASGGDSGIVEMAKSYKDLGVDIIGLQEDGNKANFLAENLGFYKASFGNGKSVVSRYPVLRKEVLSYGVVALLSVQKSFVIVASFHLPAYPYGPYLSCFEGSTKEEVEQKEYQTRGKHLFDMMEVIEKRFIRNYEKNLPIIVMGDFNAPSHVDWMLDKQNPSKKNCQFDHVYPVTKMMEDYHFQDIFRTIHPDVVSFPGYTWSPLVKQSSYGTAPEPQDRIDFIFKRGSLIKIKDSNLANIPMTDHTGVMTDVLLYTPI